MAHQAPDFETKDVLGTTQHFNGGVGLVSALVPSIAGKKLSRVVIRNSNSNSFNKLLKIALDGNNTYWTLQKGETMEWFPKSNASNSPITQIRIEGSEEIVSYEIIMDFEP
jgi:hypothetical protein